jgi:hypothetical protein
MMNFLLLSRYESALVEAKKALKLYDDYPDALGGDLFTRALAAQCFENMNQTDGAYIEYKKIADKMADPASLAPRLYRYAKRLGRKEDVKKYEKYVDPSRLTNTGENDSELVLFYGVGSVPKKVAGNLVVPPSIRISFPRYESYRTIMDESIRLLPGGRYPDLTISSDLGEVAEASLKKRATLMMTKEGFRAGIKETVARAVESNNNEALGILVRATFFLMEEADTRSWQTLPGLLKLVVFRVDPGFHTLTIEIVGGHGGVVNEIHLPKIHFYPGRKIYYSIRGGR